MKESQVEAALQQANVVLNLASPGLLFEEAIVK
jgi:hypothetical protein